VGEGDTRALAALHRGTFRGDKPRPRCRSPLRLVEFPETPSESRDGAIIPYIGKMSREKIPKIRKKDK